MQVGIKNLVIFGFNVQGIDNRDGSCFEDFATVALTPNGDTQAAENHVRKSYQLKGYALTKLEFESSYPVSFNLLELYKASRDKEV